MTNIDPASAPDDSPPWVVVIGASAGGVEGLRTIAAGLPSDPKAAICVALHVSPSTKSRLPEILARTGSLPATHATDGDLLAAGRILVAPPGKHLIISNAHVHVTSGPKENGHRPAIDTLFRSAAETYGPRVIGVLLSGASEDGTAGLAAIKSAGGTAVVLDPRDALYPAMPQSAIDEVSVDFVLPANEINEAIGNLLLRDPDQLEHPSQLDRRRGPSGSARKQPGDPPPGKVSPFTCPDCGGSLWESDLGGVSQYQCRVGHTFSLDGLDQAQSNALEAAMWSALRALEETIALSERIAERSREAGNERTASKFERRGARLTEHARLIRSVVVDSESVTSAPER